ncbi:AraC family transcriptional regulator [Pelagibaculum spongiae]|uniref:AraC family transcriptional regulator n=1 Tax=Pelagibaculum spongiae TaxID=2080658 RepID=A0A2V1H709_9GAMM|nr:AraC family transcriptional regulator [Pelagibaculum spongiae]PVZ72222.1 AraC family transcriptional regulator [Pelagibaculum spongiae]
MNAKLDLTDSDMTHSDRYKMSAGMANTRPEKHPPFHLASSTSNSSNSDSSNIHKPGLEFSKANLSDFSFGKHVHLDYHIGVVSQGVQLFSSRKGIEPLAPGRIALLNPDVVHDGAAQSSDGYSLHVIRLEPQTLQSLMEDLTDKFQLQYLPDTIIDDPKLYRQLLQLHHYSQKPSSSQHPSQQAEPLAWQACWLETMASLFQQYSHLQPKTNFIKNGRGLSLKQKSYLHDYLLADLSAKHKLEDLSALFGISSFQFLRRFQASCGMTPHAYLMSLRIDFSRRLLRQGGKPAAVAAAVGFYDQSHFVHAFRKANGMTPSAYCKQL